MTTNIATTAVAIVPTFSIDRNFAYVSCAVPNSLFVVMISPFFIAKLARGVTLYYRRLKSYPPSFWIEYLSVP